MAHLDVVRAVEGRLKANFNACEIRVENEFTETPSGNEPWLLIDFPLTTSKQATIGSPGANRWREEGAFRIVLSVPARAGAHQGRAWLDEIATLFRGKSFDGVRTYAPTSATSDDRNDIGAFFRLSIAVPYDFSIIG